jgi:hypothetical protein
LGKRNFAPRDWPALPAAERAQMRRIPTADPVGYGQAFEITAVMSNPETTEICQDWMVERIRIKSRTTPRCTVEFRRLEHPLWETKFYAQRLSREIARSVAELRKNLVQRPD